MDKYDVHVNCSTLPIYSFYKIIETFDYRYLIKGYFGNIDITIDDAEPFENIFKKIVDEYNLLSTEKIEIKDLKHQILIAEYEFKYITTINILKLYSDYPEIEVLVLLRDIGWRIDLNKSVGPQIDKITKLCTGLEMKIKIQKVKYSKKYEKKEKQVASNISIDKEALYLESNLELGYYLNPKETSCERWCNLKKLNKEKADYNEKLKVKK